MLVIIPWFNMCSLHHVNNKTTFQRKYVGTHGFPTLLLSVHVVLSIFHVNFYSCYIIIALKMFQSSNGVMQGICSKLDGALLYPWRITLCGKLSISCVVLNIINKGSFVMVGQNFAR